MELHNSRYTRRRGASGASVDISTYLEQEGRYRGIRNTAAFRSSSELQGQVGVGVPGVAVVPRPRVVNLSSSTNSRQEHPSNQLLGAYGVPSDQFSRPTTPGQLGASFSKASLNDLGEASPSVSSDVDLQRSFSMEGDAAQWHTRPVTFPKAERPISRSSSRPGPPARTGSPTNCAANHSPQHDCGGADPDSDEDAQQEAEEGQRCGDDLTGHWSE